MKAHSKFLPVFFTILAIQIISAQNAEKDISKKSKKFSKLDKAKKLSKVDFDDDDKVGEQNDQFKGLYRGT